MKWYSRFGVTLLCTVLLAGPLWARGGGGCLEQGTPISTPSGLVPIERLAPGNAVWAVRGSKLLSATVQACIKVQSDEFVEITVAGSTIRATAEHPIQVAPGVFREAGRLRPGDTLWLCEKQQVAPTRLLSTRRVKASLPAYNLLVSPGGTYLANGLVVHNKGCFLPDTPILRADRTMAAIRDIRPGEELLAFTPEGKPIRTTVRRVVTHEVEEYWIVATERLVLRVTPDHPFYIGDGTFRTLESLEVGDQIYAYGGSGLSTQPIVRIERVCARTRVYNLQTGDPHTFFANGIAVHNKGGGGGCFPAGTPIRIPDGCVAIEQLVVGNSVLGVRPDGEVVRAVVRAIHATRAALLVIETEAGALWTTADHPLAVGGDQFQPAGDLQPGDQIVACRQGRISAVQVRTVRFLEDEKVVFNLEVDEPHTFIANGFVVHNKGGGGGSGGGIVIGRPYSSGTRSSNRTATPPLQPRPRGEHLAIFAYSPNAPFPASLPWGGLVLAQRTPPEMRSASPPPSGGSKASAILAGLIVAGLIVAGYLALHSNRPNKLDENLDYVYGPQAVAAKAAKTQKLLEFLAKQDDTVAPDLLRETAKAAFLQLQQCWQAREYGPMQPMLMPDLYAQHCGQLAGMKRNHEINLIADLHLEQIDIVNIRYMHSAEQRAFTALITAHARDYYVDDRTHSFLRGDDAPARFQEFWTFHRQGNAWLLRQIEQTRESDVLKEENFVEMFTDQQLQGVYRDAATQGGPAGPWLEAEVETKATRIERLLNFLVQTDKLWNRKLMIERARQIFLSVYLAQEAGDPATIKTDELFPEAAAHLQDAIRKRREQGQSIEYRNLCVRKVEIILVRNLADNNEDEFTVRISAHAQRVARRDGVVVRQDEYVTPFEDYWTFGRHQGQWKLKEVLPPARGEQLVTQENIEEESSPEQLQWYYGKGRAV